MILQYCFGSSKPWSNTETKEKHAVLRYQGFARNYVAHFHFPGFKQHAGFFNGFHEAQEGWQRGLTVLHFSPLCLLEGFLAGILPGPPKYAHVTRRRWGQSSVGCRDGPRGIVERHWAPAEGKQALIIHCSLPAFIPALHRTGSSSVSDKPREQELRPLRVTTTHSALSPGLCNGLAGLSLRQLLSSHSPCPLNLPVPILTGATEHSKRYWRSSPPSQIPEATVSERNALLEASSC